MLFLPRSKARPADKQQFNLATSYPLLDSPDPKNTQSTMGKVLVNIQLENMDLVSALKLHALLSVWQAVIGSPP